MDKIDFRKMLLDEITEESSDFYRSLVMKKSC